MISGIHKDSDIIKISRKFWIAGSHGNIMEEEKELDEVSLYKRRWLLLTATCLWSTIDLYMPECFGAANQLIAVYFETTLDQIDWMLLGLYAGTILITPLFAFLNHADYMGFRYMSITALSCLLFSCVVTILTVQYPFLHPLLIPSNFLLGVAYTVSACVTTFFPVLWFPDDEVRIAIASLSASMTLGGLLSSVIPPAVIKPISYEIFLNTSVNSNTTSSELKNWRLSTHSTLLWMFSALACTLFVLLLYIVIFAEDLPPKPPTRAMLLKRFLSTERPPLSQSFKDFFGDTKLLFKNKIFLLCTIVLGITHNLIVVEILHISQIVGKITNYSNKYGLPNSVLSGLVLVVFTTSGIVVVFLAAKVLQKFKHYTRQTIFGTTVGLLSGIAILLCYHYDILSGIFVFNVILSSANRFCVIPMMDAVTRHTYPMNEAFVSVWMTGVGSIILIIISNIARIISNHTTPGSTLIVMCAALFLSFILSLFFDPSDKRADTDKKPAAHTEMCVPLASKN